MHNNYQEEEKANMCFLWYTWNQHFLYWPDCQEVFCSRGNRKTFLQALKSRSNHDRVDDWQQIKIWDLPTMDHGGFYLLEGNMCLKVVRKICLLSGYFHSRWLHVQMATQDGCPNWSWIFILIYFNVSFRIHKGLAYILYTHQEQLYIRKSCSLFNTGHVYQTTRDR